jgi:hypothetical protein
LGDGDKKSIYSYTLNLDVNKPYLQRFFMDGGFPAIENYDKCQQSGSRRNSIDEKKTNLSIYEQKC